MPSKSTPWSSTSKFTSPYSTSFKSAVKSGTPCGTAVSNIAKRTGKPVSFIVKSLCKAGVCYSQKFNGSYVCWPTFKTRKSPSSAKFCQTSLWQCLVDWCVLTNCCTPKQLWSKSGSQKTFMSYCRSQFGKQFSSFSKSKKSGKSKSRKSTKSRYSARTSWSVKHSTKRSSKRARPTYSTWSRSFSTRNYKFPTYKTRSSTRRYVRAA